MNDDFRDIPTLHLVIGPVAAGKTTFARQRVARMPALLLDLDAWMVRLYGDDPRPDEGALAWYLERRERVRKRNEAPGPHTQIVPPAFFERASDAWEPPGPAEREAWNIVDA